MGAIERPIMEYSFRTIDGTISSIAKPTVQAKSFEIKLPIMQIIRSSVEFFGLPNEDPNKHLANFREICDTFKFNGKSLAKYFPPAKTSNLLNDITSFTRYNLSIMVSLWLTELRTIDATASGTSMKNLPSKVFNIIDEVATNPYSYGQERTRGSNRIIGSNGCSNTKNRSLWRCNVEWCNNNTLWSMGQMGNLSQDCQGQLPSDTEKNPREKVNAITVKSKKIARDEPPKEQVEETQAQKEKEPQEETKGIPL
ncbi:hypothetical protein Sango_0116900 [Sesamum angolense]|uniref:Uncharacterized protein n=1 Tax=Sesamum angolense TaxID=2727404 RepID=A0AAE1XEU4_9LAMI|nr:hypothetical protein Sango_0116900 [Sesamum angolense]